MAVSALAWAMVGAAALQQVPEPDPALADRMARLEKRIDDLEARNAALEAELKASRSAAPVMAAALPKPPSPPVADAFVPADPHSFTFRPHMVFQQDSAVYSSRRGGYDFSDGTLLRHASLWAEGGYGPFTYQIVLDLPNGSVSVTDAWLRYRLSPNVMVTAGLQKAPFGFQYSNNDNYDIFIERSMFGNAAANAGSGRRVGLSAMWQSDRLTLAGGLFGDNAGLGRPARTSVAGAADDSVGFDGRASWRPVLAPHRALSLGISGYHRQSLRTADVENGVRFTDRPNVRVDGGNIADSGIVPNVKALDYLGADAVGIVGPVMISGEYGSAWLRRPARRDVRFDGFYVMGSLFLTGEGYGLTRGQLDRLRPLREVGKGGLGAVELTLRYDRIDLGDTPVLANRGNQASTITAGLNWYLTPYAKLLINYIRFHGRHSPLDPVGNEVSGDVIATRLHVDM